ncbi:MAG: hypothetical protein WBW04_17615, partial [Nitrolancea sp.]
MSDTTNRLPLPMAIETASDVDAGRHAKESSRARARLGTVVRVLVSIALLVFVFRRTSWSDI